MYKNVRVGRDHLVFRGQVKCLFIFEITNSAREVEITIDAVVIIGSKSNKSPGTTNTHVLADLEGKKRKKKEKKEKRKEKKRKGTKGKKESE